MFLPSPTSPDLGGVGSTGRPTVDTQGRREVGWDVGWMGGHGLPR